MSGTLRVNPQDLRDASIAQGQRGATIAGMEIGQPLNSAAIAIVDLQSGSACQFASDLLVEVASDVAGELSSHSENLQSAAAQYEQADEAPLRRLQQSVERIVDR